MSWIAFFPPNVEKKGVALSTTKHIFDSERGRREPLPHGKIYASTATGGGLWMFRADARVGQFLTGIFGPYLQGIVKVVKVAADVFFFDLVASSTPQEILTWNPNIAIFFWAQFPEKWRPMAA